jgi:branched-subunit amino acid ABC-type transport system permease component
MLKAQIVSVMMVTLGLLIFLKAVCLAIWGPDQIAFPQIFPSGAIDFAGIFITYNYVAAFALASALNIGFLLFYRFTSLGLMQRCAADNSRAALAIGIHVSNQVSIAWAVSAALAGLGGTLLASLGGLSLGISDIGLIAFPVIVVGGLDSLAGALIAGFLLGILEAFTEGIRLRISKSSADVSNVNRLAPFSRSFPTPFLSLCAPSPARYFWAAGARTGVMQMTMRSFSSALLLRSFALIGYESNRSWPT